MNTRVAITGLGFVGAVGNGVDELRRALSAGACGLKPLTLFKSELAAEFPVGEYSGDLSDDFKARRRALSKRERQRLSRSDLLALLAAAECVDQARLSARELRACSAGVYLGQSVCGTLDSELRYLECAQEGAKLGRASSRNLNALYVHEGANSCDAIAREFEIAGPVASFMTACSSGANAIGLAAAQIASGKADLMVAGGADSLSRIAYFGFHSLGVMSPEGPRPFDANRKGMCVGEGAGMLVLESEAHAKNRGAKILGWLSGYGHTCDSHHLTAPHPEGIGAIGAMKLALADAQLSPAHIGYVSAHGTGTLDNDRVESLAIAHVFGERSVPVSSTMRLFGHTLAASGGIKAVICLLALADKTLPANFGLNTPQDNALDLLAQPRKAPHIKHVISNSFGFGGNNAALVFTEAP